jgi:hypothetical protein
LSWSVWGKAMRGEQAHARVFMGRTPKSPVPAACGPKARGTETGDSIEGHRMGKGPPTLAEALSGDAGTGVYVLW